MVEALKWLQKNPDDAIICTDSLSIHSALANNDWRNNTNLIVQIKELTENIKQKVTFLWIPAHCNLHGNDKVDSLAKTGTMMNQDNTPVTFAIAKPEF